MLTYLKIKDLAIISEQELEFRSGFCVFSGETGAGKSIILQALELVLGARASADLIRSAADSFDVQAIFDISLLSDGERAGFPEFVTGPELTVSRTLNRSGRSKTFINAQPVPLAVLADFMPKILNICRQGEQIQLLNPDYHLTLIDLFASNQSEKKTYISNYDKWSVARKEFEELSEKIKYREDRIAELEESKAELEALDLQPGLREELEGKIKRISSSQKIIDSLNQLSQSFYSETGIYSSFSSLAAQIKQIQKIEPQAEAWGAALHNAEILLTDIDSDIQKILSGLNAEPGELELMQSRLADIARLERKYRLKGNDLIVLLSQVQEELKTFLNPLGVQKKEQELIELTAQMKKSADILRKSRLTAASKLSELVESELIELNMQSAKLEVKIEDSDFSVTGADKIEIFISTNKGEESKPLKKIASGGELSRIMLVLKKILNENRGANVLIFDEIDSGVSGKVARSIGEKLKALSANSQVICITHLPQVASLADQHFLVEKHSSDRTTSTVKDLSVQERIEELARMLSGHKVTDTARDTAREMLLST